MIENILNKKICLALNDIYNINVNPDIILVQQTRVEFEGDYTVVVFPLLRYSKKNPEDTANDIGEYLTKNLKEVKSFNVIKGFLNLVIDDNFWIDFFNLNFNNDNFGIKPQEKSSKPVVVEYSSPNTNKPLHLGHIRNNLLGYSVAEILKANGKNVVKVNLVNNRGIHICKSILAWKKWGNNETPESTGMKGDHLVGKYYVLFETKYKEEVKKMVSEGIFNEEEAKKNAPLLLEAQEMLRKWEAKDKEVIDLWTMMNDWVYKGFDVTYNRLGIDFDKIYYESDTYLLGKELVNTGLKNNFLFQKPDGSVWADLKDKGLDEKLLLRKDGTSVYITQDLGTAKLRYTEYNPEKLIYVVGNEQNYHFDVLKLILEKLGENWFQIIHHLSYGMVELPHGKMKSREGTVVDADDLMDEMFSTARKTTEELGKIKDFSEEKANELYNIVSLGALKYFILKVDPKKNMMFNPEESIDFNGNTGPFIQYTYARIQSILKKAGNSNNIPDYDGIKINKKEKELLKLLYQFPEVITQAGKDYSPATIANYVFTLVKNYNKYYQEVPILKVDDNNTKNFRVLLSEFIANVIKTSMKLLGIEVPVRM
ncbi:MAG: arginine--tRNA ligase [Bacteroidales bacterium]|nr:arginine--tRNA ligase [Bacteroidales bacterium]